MNTGYYLPEDIRDNVRILIVEDNLLNRKLDDFLFSNWGLKHEICDNGRAAVEKLRSGAVYDLILMDIVMPEMNGCEATRKIREELKLGMPVIGITAHPTEMQKQKCIESGMNYYISKPVQEEELLALIMNCLVPVETLR
jgi:CheY-like chemotaxis protein